MFGIICAGRPVQLDLNQVEANKYLADIKDGSKVNHVVVFLLPGAVLPDNTAASVYFQLPGGEFQLLGVLSNSKPSAIFKINNNPVKHSAATNTDLDEMVDDDDKQTQVSDILVGISIEPLDVVNQALEDKRNKSLQTLTLMKNANQTPESTAILANKIVRHAYNFLSGFTNNAGMVPIKVFDDWWAKFKTRLATNPQFLDNLD